MDNTLNILFVAFEFPPLLSGGVQRSVKFVKYLPDFGVTPIVVTVEEEDYPKILNNYALDSAMLGELPEGTQIVRVHCDPSPAPLNRVSKWASMYFSISENFKVTWKKGLEKTLPSLFKKYQPVAVYLSLPPFAMGELWLGLLRNNRVPLIVDFRDAWSQWCLAPNGSYLHYFFKLKAERRLLLRASKVILSSRQTMLDMQRVHPMIDAAKFAVIPNGYDTVLPDMESMKLSGTGKIIIGYVGSFYYTPESRREIFQPWWKKPVHRMLNYVPRKEDWLYRSPYFFFRSVQELIKRDLGWKERIEIRFAGNTPSWLLEQIELFGLGEICSHRGFLDHDAVLRFQKECDILLITSSKVIGGKDYSIAGKTFEYFTIGKPILGFVTEGEQRNILAESGIAVLCDPDDPETSATKMEQLFKNKISLKPDLTTLEKYHRSVLSGKLASLIKDAVQDGHQQSCAESQA